jgi:predicted class III extradiol MEMO1 family dioxygenase
MPQNTYADVTYDRHAGYSYSGPAAAWAYKSVNTTGMSVDTVVVHLVEPTNLLLQLSKRVFILGPSHNVYLNGCALSKFTEYATPLGGLPLDRSSTPLIACFSPQYYEPKFQPLMN